MSKVKIEIVCANIESVIAAEQGGADRIELCDNLAEGGTTPGYGMIESARKKVSGGLFVMIRPRGGDFLYSDEEFEIMKRDIQICKQLNVDGVVFGLLDADGNVDFKRTTELVLEAGQMLCTFHRAFDLANEPFKAMEDIIGCGCTRILTSGQHSTAIEGAELISKLVQKANNRIIILAGGGVRPGNVETLISKTKVTEVHSSAKINRISKMKYKSDAAKMGNPESDEYTISVVDIETVKSLRKAVSSF